MNFSLRLLTSSTNLGSLTSSQIFSVSKLGIGEPMTSLGRPLAAAEASSPPAIGNSATCSWAVKYARWLILADAACIVLTIVLAAWQLP